MKFKPVRLTSGEKGAFIKYMEGRGLSPSTINSVIYYLGVSYANTKHSRRKARYARRVYEDFTQQEGG